MNRFLTIYYEDKSWRRQSHVGPIDSIIFFPKVYKNQSLWERKIIEVHFWGRIYQVRGRYDDELIWTGREKRSNSNEIFLCIHKIFENDFTRG